MGADSEPIGPAELRMVAEAVPAGVDVVASWWPGPTVAEYAAAGATWLVDSRWPDGEWLDELAESASRDPRSTT